jgi:hypothetical protein
MKVKVRVRLFLDSGVEEITAGILSNEEAGAEGGCELLVDGARWTGRFDVLGPVDSGQVATAKEQGRRTLRDILADIDAAAARGEPYIPE